ncbi:MAG TPA: HEAT repeat domain-containing protein [Ktedonosporobacter sp.]|nr:HEAT repeat domain-containing protein [Ktedonosporobacter sp.]
MSQPSWSQELISASIDTCGELGPQVILEDFLQRWGGFTPEILARVLQEEQVPAFKTFALFAPGYLAPPEASSLLLPFLQSEKRHERWASAVSLGRLRNEQAFTLLQEMLLEGLSNSSVASDEDTDFDDDWYMARRFEIALLLGDGGNLAAVPVLRKAFATCWEIEIQPGNYSYDHARRWWHPLQNSLAYALGRLEAWGALSTLQLPSAHLRMALLYFIFGVLHPPMHEDQRWGAIFEQPRPFEKPYLYSDIYNSLISLDQIRQVLKERFNFSEEEQVDYLHYILQRDDQRQREHYEYGPPSPSVDMDQLFLD